MKNEKIHTNKMRRGIRQKMQDAGTKKNMVLSIPAKAETMAGTTAKVVTMN